MSRIWEKVDARRTLRLVALAVGFSLGVTVLAAVLFWLEDHLSQRTLWRAKLIFLIALELTYGIIAVLTVLLSPLLGLVLYRARKQRLRRPAHARILLLCVSVLLGLVLAEGAAAMWWKQSHRSAALPVGGWRQAAWTQKDGQLPRAPEQVELPADFPDDTGDDTVDLVIVGESSAAGVPYDWWLSISQIVSWQLGELIPGRRFRHNVVAASGDTLEGQHQKLASLTRRPDVLIIYAGHNEFAARFPWSREINHYDDSKMPGLLELIVQQAEVSSPLCRLIREGVDKCRVALPPPPSGYRTLVDEPAFTQAEFSVLLSDFERRLEAMVNFAERVGALPILILPPANDSGFEPNRSYLPPQTTRVQRETFARDFLEARRLEESDPAASQKRYQALLDRQPGFAELHYRLARLFDRSGEWDLAYRHDLAARDLDGLPQRCLTRFQETYRTVAARHHCPLIDGQQYFRKIGYHGLLDDHLFHDGFHPSLRGQLALAQAVLLALHDRKAFGWPDTVPVPVLDPARCAEHFGLTPYAWEKVCNFGIMFYDMTSGARYDPSERIAKQHAFGAALERIKAGERPEAVGLPNIGLPEPVPVVAEAAVMP
jgi:lysophospholipase L1-like esterase